MIEKEKPNPKPIQRISASSTPEAPVWREVTVDTSAIPAQKSPFPMNYISTTHYTAFTFFPMSLFNQFLNYANLYFLVVACLMSIPMISPLNPLSSWAGLIFVIFLSILREGYEDYMRYRSDRQTNSKTAIVYRNGVWTEIKWSNLQVGDLTLVQEDENFPADLILLSSSDPQGTAFIMTSSLDGEKTLKSRIAFREVQQAVPTNSPFRVCFNLNFGQPDPSLSNFDGFLQLGDQRFGLSGKQLLLRGAELRNTESVVGVVVYTGIDSKIMLNSGQTVRKISQIRRTMNKLILMIMAVQFVFCFVVCLMNGSWNLKYSPRYTEFIPGRFSWQTEAVLGFFTQFILMNGLIPISLIISLEIVQVIHAFFIDHDADMYNDPEKRFAKTLSSSLTDDLGKIQYIFTDKTGTLTRNILAFKYAIVADRLLLGGPPSPKENQGSVLGKAKTLRESALIRAKTVSESAFSRCPTRIYRLPTRFSDTIPLELLRSERAEFCDLFDHPADFQLLDNDGAVLAELPSAIKVLELFLTALSICHDCILDTDKKNPSVFKYSGTSPDEIVLVTAAKDAGFMFLKNTNGGKMVRIQGQETEFPVKCFFEFNSDRKRSSIILEWQGVILHLIKGADSIVMQRLRTDIDPFELQSLQASLESFSLQGLRTLVFGAKAYSAAEWAAIQETLKGLQAAPDRQQQMDALADRLERGFTLLGCTAVEDRLQDKVPSTIADFLAANIRVWMLTGDKMETAENIAFSCRLIQETFVKHYLLMEDDLLAKISEIESSARNSGQKVALIMEGPLIARILGDQELAQEMADRVFSKVQAVVCFRMSPNDKGDVVSLVREHQNRVTLAVGDGANDVNMIKRAHIGVGLFGQEGLRAAQSADFAFVDFKSLWRLLFVHGHWSYIRISDMVLYFFYKCAVFTMVQFFFAMDNAYSSQSIYDPFYITFYNLFFTSWPLLIRATFDQDIYYKKWTKNAESGVKTLAENRLLKKFYPYLYYFGQLNKGFKFAQKPDSLPRLVSQRRLLRGLHLLLRQVLVQPGNHDPVRSGSEHLVHRGRVLHRSSSRRLIRPSTPNLSSTRRPTTSSPSAPSWSCR